MTALKLLHLQALRGAIILLSAVWLAAPLHASFDDIGAGARAAGMADAQTALADDANAAFHNPAGLIQNGDPRLSAELGDYARGLSDGSTLGSTYLGYSHPLVVGETVLGLAYRSFKATDIVEERTYLLGAGRRLRVRPFGWDGVWSVGANLKLLQREFSGGPFAANAINDAGSASGTADPLLNGGARSSALGLDAGGLFQFGRGLNSSVGLMILNLNRPDVSLGSGDTATRILKIGVAHRPRWGAVTAEVRRAERLGQPDMDLALGAERHFRLVGHNALSLRGGYAEGSRGYKAVTAGAAYHFGRFTFDYALSFPIGNLSRTDGHQRIGFSMRFGTTSVRAAHAATAPPAISVAVTASTAAVAPTREDAEAVEMPLMAIENALRELQRLGSSADEDIESLRREIEAIKKATGIGPEPAAVAVSSAPVNVAAPAQIKRPRAPAKAPVASPRPRAKTAPAPAPNAQTDRAWRFYGEAVERGISDPERIEILDGMLRRFGEREAGRINRELEKLRKRGPKASKRAQ